MPIAKKDTNGYWAVDGAPLFVPNQRPSISHDVLEGPSSGRSEDGVNHIDILRRDVVTVNMAYGLLTGNEMEELVSMVQGKVYQGTYRDYGKAQTRTFYTGSVSYDEYFDDMFADEGGLYTGISFTMEEV